MSRFSNNNKDGKAAFISVYEAGIKVTDVAQLSEVADKIESGHCKVECFINKDGEPTMLIRL